MRLDRGEVKEPDFLIVGSPRSGTTLVQRLACELPGVHVTPETHFYSVFYDLALRGRDFPLGAGDLQALLRQYLLTPAVQGLPVDVDAVVDSLEGRCATSWQLFSHIVCDLAGKSEVIGEKTPSHLRWWLPLSHAAPNLKFVAVLRDPRAVVSSAQAVPFGMNSAKLLAARWKQDFRDIQVATRALGRNRLLVLRYEDVVSDVGRAQGALADFLGVESAPLPIGEQGLDLFLPWESSWKARARGPVTESRATAWRTTMTLRQQRQVEAVVGRALTEAGYDSVGANRQTMWRALSPVDWVALARFHRSRLSQQRRIRATVVG